MSVFFSVVVMLRSTYPRKASSHVSVVRRLSKTLIFQYSGMKVICCIGLSSVEEMCHSFFSSD